MSAVDNIDDFTAPATSLAELNLAAEVFSSGMNGALRRWPNVETTALPLFDKRAGLQPSWKPHWTRISTCGVTFPLGFEFQPKPPEAAESEQLKSLEPPPPKSSDLAERAEPPAERK